MQNDTSDQTLRHSNGDRWQNVTTESFHDSDDWEYEYDEEETEDFYMTLDLTTHVQEPLTNHIKVSNNGKHTKGILDQRLKEYKRMSRHSSPTSGNASSKTGTPAKGAVDAGFESTGQDTQQEQQVPPAAVARMQLIGLHTTTPYLLFDNKFYTTYWLTDLGTQIWVSRPGVTDSPVWSGHVLDIVGSSQVRLLAKPAKLQPRYDDTAAVAARGAPFDDGSAAQLGTLHTGMADTTLRNQTSFMERLSALKVKKGELDQVPYYCVKAYEYPSNAAEIRAESWAAMEKAQPGASSNAKAQFSTSRASTSARSTERHRRSASVQSTALTSDIAVSVPGDHDEEQDEVDDDIEDDNEEGSSSRAATSQRYLPDGRPKETRGRTKRSTKLAGLGLARHDESPKPKRRRRNKAQMAELRAAADGAWVANFSQQ